ncbi:hypothetical protein ACHAXA_003503 [Cyclostephanos tholiformis]|uniref:Uncharacterized protein n=1 Tax=Cyclostephanos tholiformis TaxID=382380 RepID=A0ABD3SF94_9STRA
MSATRSCPRSPPEVGSKVRLVGLMNPYLNDKIGTISGYARDGERVMISVDDGPPGLVKVKLEKIVVLEGPSQMEGEATSGNSRRWKLVSALSWSSSQGERSGPSSKTSPTTRDADKRRQHWTNSLTASDSFVEDPEDTYTRVKATIPVVNLTVFQITAGGKVVPYHGDPNDGLADALSSSPGDQTDEMSFWVHVEADERNREALDKWIDKLNLGIYISDQIKRPANEWMSSVMCTKSTALVMLRVLQFIDDDGTFELDEVEYLTAIVTKRMLLTYDVIDVRSAHNTNALIAHMTRDEVLRDTSSSAALISWLEYHIRNTKNAAVGLRNDSVRMTKKMDLDPKMLHLRDILDLRGDVFFVDSVAEEQDQCLGMMRDMDTESDGADFEKVEGALQMLVKTAKSTELMMERVGKRVEDLKNAYGAHQQERLNQKLGVLTALSAIFMPLTFWAGVYGMNFENIPELSTENGYFVWWGVMVAMGIALTTLLYMDGWFASTHY